MTPTPLTKTNPGTITPDTQDTTPQSQPGHVHVSRGCASAHDESGHPQPIPPQPYHDPPSTITIQPPLQPQRKRKRNPRDDNPQTPENQAPILKKQNTQNTPAAPTTLPPTTTTPLPHHKRKHNPQQDDAQAPEGLPPQPKRQRSSTHHMTMRRRAPSPVSDVL
jgi:hypothetical protein